MNKVIIVGAGISGLTSAIELEKQGISPTIFDSNDRVGGRLRSEQVDGVWLDHGFQVLLSAYPNFNKYIDREALECITFKPGAAVYLHKKRILLGDPQRDISFLLPTLFGSIATLRDIVLTWKLKRQLQAISPIDCFQIPEKATIDHLKEYGFSESYIERFFKPFFAGIFLEKELKTSNRMFAFVFKMFSEGHALLPIHGIQSIAEHLKSKLSQSNFRLDEGVKSIDEQTLVTESDSLISFDKAILSSSAVDGDLQEDQQEWNSCINMYFSYGGNLASDIINLLPGDFLLNNFHVLSTKRPNGERILSATVIGKSELSDSELAGRVRNELMEACEISVGDLLRIYRIEKALPIIESMNYSGQIRTNQAESQVLAGDYLANPSLNAAMETGRQAAEHILESL